MNIENYENGSLNGESLYYFSDGRNIQCISNYKMEKYGEQKEYNEIGNIRYIRDYKEDGSMEVKTYNWFRVLVNKVNYFNSRKHGKEIMYNLNGTVKSEKEYDMGVLINSSQ